MRDMLTETGKALYGPCWQRELARALHVNERTMRRWVSGETQPPSTIAAELTELIRLKIFRLSDLRKQFNNRLRDT